MAFPSPAARSRGSKPARRSAPTAARSRSTTALPVASETRAKSIADDRALVSERVLARVGVHAAVALCAGPLVNGNSVAVVLDRNAAGRVDAIPRIERDVVGAYALEEAAVISPEQSEHA